MSVAGKALFNNVQAAHAAGIHACALASQTAKSFVGSLGTPCAGVPIKPMLAKASEGVGDALRALRGAPRVLAEYKYDGMRAQIHLLEGGQVGAPRFKSV